MTIMEMLGQSGVLSLLGMGVVFLFLFILVIAVTVMGKIVQALGINDAGTQSSGGASNASESTAVTAAITAAVTEYQKTKKG